MDCKDILKLNGKDFIEEAYLKILLRNADSGGLDNFSNKLSQGISKERIILELCTSSEGLIKNVPIDKIVFDEYSIKDLIALEDASFVKATFLVLFGRTPREEEAENISDLLKEGFDKKLIINALIESNQDKLKVKKIIGKTSKSLFVSKAEKSQKEKLKSRIGIINNYNDAQNFDSQLKHTMQKEIDYLKQEINVLKRAYSTDRINNKYCIKYDAYEIEELSNISEKYINSSYKNALNLCDYQDEWEKHLTNLGIDVTNSDDLLNYLYHAERSSFDIISVLGGLDNYSLKEIIDFIYETYRVLKSGGIFVLRMVDICYSQNKDGSYKEMIKNIMREANFNDEIEEYQLGLYTLFIGRKL